MMSREYRFKRTDAECGNETFCFRHVLKNPERVREINEILVEMLLAKVEGETNTETLTTEETDNAATFTARIGNDQNHA